MEKKILVKYSYTLLYNETNKYCVFQYMLLNNKGNGKGKSAGRVICTGYSLPNVSIPYEFTVEEIEHPKYGFQYKVLGYEEKINSDKASVIEYLGCGLFRGIGKTTAERIYQKFGEQTLDVFHNQMDRLIEVKGISKRTLKKIKESYENNMVSREIQQYLIPFGIPNNLIMKLCNAFPKDTMSLIKSNPYVLCKINGISFRMADAVGHSEDIAKDDPRRLEAALMEALKMNNQTGSVGAPSALLLDYYKKVSGIYDEKFLWKTILDAVYNQKISYVRKNIDGKQLLYFYLNHIYEAEKELAEVITKIVNEPCREYADLNTTILDCCYNAGIILDESQFSAIKNAFLHNFTVITGGPGTGKTTISKIIIMVQEALKKTSRIELLAPTGRAARRMTECMQKPASTIHSRLSLGIHGDDVDRLYTEDVEPIDCDMLICDEFSMVDMMLALKLFSSRRRGRLVIVGDKDQLASVGAGNVLKDIIESGTVPVSTLEYTHRQDESSVICINAHNMQDGVTTLMDGSDFYNNYFEDTPRNTLLKTIEDKMVEQYLADYNDEEIKSIVCLSPYKENAAGVFSLNRRIQDAINPLNKRVEVPIANNMVLRVGDMVMHLQNTDEVCNGDIGFVTRIEMENGKPVVTVDYRYSGGPSDYEYQKDTLNLVTLAYAMTVHKSQGGEYDSVISCMTKQHRMLLKRNILYTGITRAKKKVTNFFDTPDTVAQAIQNVQCEERYTLLSYWLKEMAPKPKEEEKKEEEIYEQQCLFTA